MRLAEATDFDKLPLRDLIASWSATTGTCLHDTHVEVDMINIAARYFLDTARQALDKAGLEPTVLLSAAPATQLSNTLAAALDTAPEHRRTAMLACVAHRATIDYELSDPRFAEDDTGLDAFLAALLPANRSQRPPTSLDSIRDDDTAQFIEDAGLCAAVNRARRFQTLKEDAKHAALRELAVLRRIALAIDRRLGLDGLVFYCTVDEVARLGPGRDTSVLLAARQTRDRLLAALPLGRTLRARDLELGPLVDTASLAAAAADLNGTRVAGGDGIVHGRAHVVSAEQAEAGAPLDGFVPGDIIVSPMLHAAWLPQVIEAAAVVNEVGGWLSHMAIIAREHAIPMIVGVAALARIHHGTRLQIDGDGHIIDLGPGDRKLPVLMAAS